MEKINILDCIKIKNVGVSVILILSLEMTHFQSTERVFLS
jgi:hypothetical protein